MFYNLEARSRMLGTLVGFSRKNENRVDLEANLQTKSIAIAQHVRS